ncbi:TPA: hypothetical protein O6L53_002749 [Staphylococcus aureus]|nr:hypothetical protein [Staphylococcus aureus]HDB3143342.1 hypothetical protein [Staphylococcus aureus]HDE8374477.1 hypothetical protein [Staphylococcus aureus]
MGRNSNSFIDFNNTANVNNQESDLYEKNELEDTNESVEEVDHEQENNELQDLKKEKKKTEYKGELGSILNEESSGHKFIGFNIDMDISDRLDAFCEGKPRGTKTRLVNLILRNGLDNIENKGKL